jgi:hypothetical protein
MELEDAIRNAVVSCIETRDHPVMDERAKALNEVAGLLEDIVCERLDDEQLAASLDGLHARRVVFDGEMTLNISGAFYTLGVAAQGRRGDPMLPMDALLSGLTATLTLRDGTTAVVFIRHPDHAVSSPRGEVECWVVHAPTARRPPGALHDQRPGPIVAR